jgi:hypothetical protein
MLEIKRLLQEFTLEQICQLVEKMKLVSEDTCPTDDEIKLLEPYTDLSVGSQSDKDWYCLLRKCQGSYMKTLAAGYMIEDHYTPRDFYNNLWIEFAYVWNLDTAEFQIYQQDPTPTAVLDMYNLPVCNE